MRAPLFLLLMPLIVASCAVESGSPAGQDAFLADMAAVMANMRDYTLEVYDLPADSNMDFRPTQDVMSFREQAAHIASNLYLHQECYVKPEGVNTDRAMEGVAAIMAIEDRAALREKIRGQFDAMIAEINTLKGRADWNVTRPMPQFDGSPERDLITILMMARDHISHHRGQMVVYLRLMGHEPPAYKPF